VDGDRLRRATSARRDGANEQARGVGGLEARGALRVILWISRESKKLIRTRRKAAAVRSDDVIMAWLVSAAFLGRETEGMQRLLFVAVRFGPP